MIPAAGAAYLHHVYGEFVKAGREQDKLLCGACGTRHGAQVVTEHPRHQGELLLAADRAHHRAGLAVELGGPQQIRVGVANLRDPGASRVHLGQQGPPPQGVVHYLSLQSHEVQSTSAPRAPRLGVRPDTASKRPGTGFNRVWPAPSALDLLRSPTWLRGAQDDGRRRHGQRTAIATRRASCSTRPWPRVSCR